MRARGAGAASTSGSGDFHWFMDGPWGSRLRPWAENAQMVSARSGRINFVLKRVTVLPISPTVVVG